MINTITICPDGHLIPESDCLGRTGEHNATVLKFDFFEDLNGESISTLQKILVVILQEGVIRYPIDGAFNIPEELTVCDELVVLVEIKKDGEILFKSCPHTFKFVQSGDRPEVNLIQVVVDAAKKGCCDDLSSSLETATGEAQDGKTWDELNETVSTLPVISEEQTQALGDLDLIKAYFADCSRSWHDLFRYAPTDDTGANREYRLPYIYTPKMAWAEKNLYISTELLEFGVDVSSAVNLGGGTSKNTFQPLPKLQKLILTGNENSPSLQYFMYQNSALQYLKMDTPSEEVLRANPKYYETAFHSCTHLVTIDCELDFIGQTSTLRMFEGCNNLKNLRIKPFTLSCSLNVSACKYFTHPTIRDNSLLAILNALSNDKEKNKDITITYSNETWSFETSGVVPGVGVPIPIEFISNTVYFTSNIDPETDEELGLYTWDRQSEASVETTLYDAFINDKGVTLAQ